MKQISEGEPLQYILGNWEFFGIEFRVDKRVFIPRPETELLVEEVCNWVKGQGSPRCRAPRDMAPPSGPSPQSPSPSGRGRCEARVKGKRILDIGTGCGNIAISIAKMMQDVEIAAVDISEEAIEVAKENVRLNGVSDRIEFLTGDLYQPFMQKKFKFDCIVSNPPYIASEEFSSLQKEVLQEPHIALDGGLDGLLFIRRIISGASEFLKEYGCIFLEIGYNQANRVEKILRENNFKDIYFVKDYNGFKRIAVAQWINL